MGKFIDRTGQRFGNLTLMERRENNKHYNATWLCKCDCGGEVICSANSLQQGHTKSCGCQANRYDKGHTPHNKGVYERLSDKCIPTEFKSGIVPHNALPSNQPRIVGSRREVVATTDEKAWRKSRSGKPILVRRRTSFARVLWKEHHGEIPKGMIIWNNGDKEDIQIQHLELITRSESMKRNAKHY